MKCAVILLVVLLAVSSLGRRTEDEYRQNFVSWMRQYSRSYGHDEFQTRYQIFKNNVDRIEEYNARNTGVTLALNKFGDLSREEFKKFYTGLIQPNTTKESDLTFDVNNLAASIDWRTRGAVTPVKNQGQCGSCWAFSSTGSLEGLHKIKTGTLTSFSEQQLVDCSTSYGNMGCNGGLMDYAFEYVAAKGIETEASYPYKAVDGTCKYSPTKEVFKNTGHKDVPSRNNDALAAALNNGPVSVAIEADQSCFQFYKGGILSDPSCGTNLDHGVLAVGYGTAGSVDYWIVKNSWGADWGESGYVRMKKVSGTGAGECGIALSASYPTA